MLKILFQADSQSVRRASFKLHSKLTPILTHKKGKKKKKNRKKRIKNIMMTATDMQPRAPHAHKLQSHKAQTRSRTAQHINATIRKGRGWLQCGKLMKLCREILSMPHNLLVAGQLQLLLLLLPPHEKEITISLWHTPFGQSWPQPGTTGTTGTTHTDTIIIKSP